MGEGRALVGFTGVVRLPPVRRLMGYAVAAPLPESCQLQRCNVVVLWCNVLHRVATQELKWIKASMISKVISFVNVGAHPCRTGYRRPALPPQGSDRVEDSKPITDIRQVTATTWVPADGYSPLKKSEPAQRQRRPSAGAGPAPARAPQSTAVYMSLVRYSVGAFVCKQLSPAEPLVRWRCNGRQARSAAPRRMQHATPRLATRQMQRPECSTDTQRATCNAQHTPFQRAPSDETSILHSAHAPSVCEPT